MSGKSHISSLIFLLVLVFLPIVGLNAYEPLVTIGKPLLNDILYSPDGRFLATLTMSYIELLDAETLAFITRADLTIGYWRKLAFSPDSSLLAISNVEESIWIWHVDSETFVANILAEHDKTIIAFSPDGKYLAYVNDDSVFLWDVEQEKVVIELTGDPNPSAWFDKHRVTGIAFHPNSKILAVGSFRNTIALWDIETGEILSYLELGFEGYQSGAILFSHDGTLLAARARYGIGSDHTVGLCDVATGESRSLRGGFYDLAFTPDDQHLLIGGGDGNLHVMETDTFKRKMIVPAVDRLPPPNIINSNCLESLTLHPDGKRLATQINSSRIRIWDTLDFIRRRTIYGYDIYVYSPAEAVYLPEINRIVTGKDTNVLHFWDATTGEFLKASEFYYRIDHIEAAPDGRNIVIDVEGTHQIWDAANIEQIEVFEARGPDWSTWEVEFSPSGKYLASIGRRGTLVWDMDAGEGLTWLDERGREGDYIGTVSSRCRLLEFTSDERQIITIQSDGETQHTTAFWDIETGKMVNEIEHIGPLVKIGVDFLQARQVEDTIEIRLLQSDRLISRIPDRLRSMRARDIFLQRQFHPSGNVLAVHYERNDAGGWEPGPWEYRFYNTHNGRLISAVAGIWDLQFTDDSRHMFLVDDKRQLGLYRISDVIGESVASVFAVNPSGKKITTFGQIKQNQLLQNYPNPFNPETWIPYELAEPADVTICIYTHSGQSVRTLRLGHKEEGIYRDKYRAGYWDGRNDAGELMASGTYFYQLEADDVSHIRKMTVLR